MMSQGDISLLEAVHMMGEWGTMSLRQTEPTQAHPDVLCGCRRRV